MSELKVGDRIKDNDPRMPNRVLKVTEITATRVKAIDAYHVASIELRRIYTDGKPRRSGFSKVES